MSTIFRDVVEVINEVDIVSFNDNPTKPTGSVAWILDTLDGWDKTAPVESSSIAVGGTSDGEILGEYFPAKSRMLTVSGVATSGTRAEADALQDLIMRDAFPTNYDIQLVRYEPVAKYITGRVVGEQVITRVGPLNFRWIVTLMAGDPFKYDWDPPADSSVAGGVAGTSVGGRSYSRTYPLQYVTTTEGEDVSATLVNRGTTDTFPLIAINGPLVKGAWRIENDRTGKFLKFDVGLSSGDILVIDFKEGTALLNGFPITSTINGTFWKVKPGPNKIKLYGDYDPAAGFSASIESAWK